MLLRLPIPQEETEQTEDRTWLRALRCLLFKPPGVRSPPNAELTDDEERAKHARIGTYGWPRSSSFGRAIGYPS